MFKAIFLVFALAILGILYAVLSSSQAPLRGMACMPGSPTKQLLARAKPAATFTLSPELSLLEAGWCDVSPESMENITGEAKMWLALYRHPKGMVVTAVADAKDRWQWEAGQHAAYKPIRSLKRPQEKFAVWETVTVLDRKHDPFCGSRSSREKDACLVYRAKMILNFDQCEVIAEYHEDLPENLALNIAYEDAFLNDFSKRAREACQIRCLKSEEAESLAQDIEKMSVLTKSVSRRSLAVWTGKMQRRGKI